MGVLNKDKNIEPYKKDIFPKTSEIFYSSKTRRKKFAYI